MKKYLAVFKINLQEAFSYRFEGLVYFMNDLLTPLLMMIVWSAIYSVHSGNIGQYSLDGMLVYYLVIFCLRTLLSVYPTHISNLIKYGDINGYLVKPMDLVWAQFFGEISWKVVRFVFALLSLAILLTTYLSKISFPPMYFMVFWFWMSLVLSVILNFFVKVVIELLSFWTVDVTGIRRVFYLFEAFFAGAVVPISLMPSWIQVASKFTPFYYFYYFPTQILFGKVSFGEIVSSLLVILLWILFAILASKILFNLGIKRYTAVSG